MHWYYFPRLEDWFSILEDHKIVDEQDCTDIT
jgi:hypothetical protein